MKKKKKLSDSSSEISFSEFTEEEVSQKTKDKYAIIFLLYEV